jgi:hypothetical protein
LDQLRLNRMRPERDHAYRNDLLLAIVMIAAGLVMIWLSLARIDARDMRTVQATHPLESPPTPAPQSHPPAESKPGGERPTTPAPEPARPDAEAQKAGAKPVLPPAPAEKTGEPIKEK